VANAIHNGSVYAPRFIEFGSGTRLQPSCTDNLPTASSPELHLARAVAEPSLHAVRPEFRGLTHAGPRRRGRHRVAKRNSENCCPSTGLGSAAVRAAIHRHHAICPYGKSTRSVISLFYQPGMLFAIAGIPKAGRYFRNFATDSQNNAGRMALRISKAVQIALRKRVYSHERRQPNVGLNAWGRRTDELDLYVDWSRYFFHLGGECRPDTGRLPGKTMRRQFREHLPPFKGPRYGRKVVKFREDCRF
jgi:hypothetical protein